MDLHKSILLWKNLGNIIALTEDEIDDIKPIENGELTMYNGADEWYDLKGQKFNKPQRGINIIQMSDGTTKKVLVK